jgi:hypothetical protein
VHEAIGDQRAHVTERDLQVRLLLQERPVALPGRLELPRGILLLQQQCLAVALVLLGHLALGLPGAAHRLL